MSFISYSQNFEDVMLWRALKDVTQGFYIDVGAHHPDHDSVTKSFYDKGWNGINIEPVAQWFELLELGRERDINLLTAVGSSEGELNFYEIPGTGLSTLDESVARLHAHNNEHEVITRNVSVRTLTDICKEYNIEDIHFLKIDVEGAEKLVIEGVNFNSINPWIILVESTYPNTQNEAFSSWEFMLLDAGYTFVYFDGLNRFYVSSEHRELTQRFSSPPNVFDDFSFALDSTSSSFCNEYVERDRKTQETHELEFLAKDKINIEALDYNLLLAGIIENKDSELKGAFAYSKSQELAAEKSLVDFQEQLLAKENEISAYVLSITSLSTALEGKDSDLKEALAFSKNQDVTAKASLADLQEQLLAKENEISEYALSISSLSDALESKVSDLKKALAYSQNQDVTAKASLGDLQEQLLAKENEISAYALSITSLSTALEGKDSDLKEALAFSKNQDVTAKASLADLQEQLLAKENEISEYALSISSLSDALESKVSDLKKALAYSQNQDVTAKASLGDLQEQLLAKENEISAYALSISSLSTALESKDSDLKEALAYSKNQDVTAKASLAGVQEQVLNKDAVILELYTEMTMLTEQLKVDELALVESKNTYDVQVLRLSNIVKSITKSNSEKDLTIYSLSKRIKYLYGIFFVLLAINLMAFYI